MNHNKHWAENLKSGDTVIGFIRHRIDGTKNRKNVTLQVTINCIEFGMNSIIGKDEHGSTFRVPFNELSKVE